MDMSKGGYTPTHVRINYRVEYIEAGHIKAEVWNGFSIEDMKETFKLFHKTGTLLSICLASDYKKLYEKYSDIMNPLTYEGKPEYARY